MDFKFIAGEHLLTQYDSGNGQLKYFCQKCGSPIMSKNTNTPELIRVRLGTIDSAITEKPEAHIFVSSKANWEEINDSLPQHDEY